MSIWCGVVFVVCESENVCSADCQLGCFGYADYDGICFCRAVARILLTRATGLFWGTRGEGSIDQ